MVVDDDKKLCQSLADFLQQKYYRVETAYDGMEALEKLNRFVPDLIILDVDMPRLNGWDTCVEIRRRPGYEYGSSKLILMFSGKYRDLVDKRTGYYVGANRYLNGRVSDDELLLEIKSLLDMISPDSPSYCEKFDDHLEICLEKHRVIVDGKQKQLTLLEHRLLEYLRSQLGKGVSEHDLILYVWNYDKNNKGSDYFASKNSLQRLISELRNKIGDQRIKNTSNYHYIKNIRGIGYMLEKPYL